jgi:hypothetical protein
LHLIDLVSDTALELPLDDDRTGELFLTPSGDVLARLISCKEGKELQIYDCAAGKLLFKHIGKLVLVEKLTDSAVLYRTREEAGGWDLAVWSVAERRLVTTLPNAGAPMTSPDGKFVVVRHVNADDEPVGTGVIWTMQHQRVEAEVQLGKDVAAPIVTSDDNRWMALFSVTEDGTRFVELRDFPSGRPAANFHGDVRKRMLFSPGGRWLALEGAEMVTPLILADVPGMNERWRQEPCLKWVGFSADAGTVFASARLSHEVIACDCETGQVRARFVALSDKAPHLQMTPDRKSLLVHQKAGRGPQRWLERLPWLGRYFHRDNDSVRIIDTDSCRLRLGLAGLGTRSARLSDDGATLATTHIEKVSDSEARMMLSCWDVDACKPLRWAVGVPAGLGALIALLAWRRRRRAKIAPAQTGQAGQPG